MISLVISWNKPRKMWFVVFNGSSMRLKTIEAIAVFVAWKRMRIFYFVQDERTIAGEKYNNNN